MNDYLPGNYNIPKHEWIKRKYTATLLHAHTL